MKIKYWLAAGAALLILIVVIIIVKKEKQPSLTFVKVKTGSITSAVTATGQLNPTTEVKVGSQVSGKIIKLYVDFNSIVKQGQLLALIDPTPFRAQLARATAGMLNAKAGILKANVMLKLDRRNYKRRLKLPHNLISAENLESAKSTYEIAAAAFTSAQAALIQAKANYRMAKFNLANTRIISPLNGIIISRNINIGQTVAASFQTPDLFDIAGNMRKMQIDTNVVETDIGRIKVGQKAEFTVDAYPNTTFTGTVAIIRSAPIVIQNVVNYDVILYVDNKDLRLKPGMTTYVNIYVKKKDNIPVIPNSALRFSPKGIDNIVRLYARRHKLPRWAVSGKGGSELKTWYRITKVWIYKDNKFIPIPIKTGIRNNNFTELLKGNLLNESRLVAGYETGQ